MGKTNVIEQEVDEIMGDLNLDLKDQDYLLRALTNFAFGLMMDSTYEKAAVEMTQIRPDLFGMEDSCGGCQCECGNGGCGA